MKLYKLSIETNLILLNSVDYFIEVLLIFLSKLLKNFLNPYVEGASKIIDDTYNDDNSNIITYFHIVQLSFPPKKVLLFSHLNEF